MDHFNIIYTGFQSHCLRFRVWFRARWRWGTGKQSEPCRRDLDALSIQQAAMKNSVSMNNVLSTAVGHKCEVTVAFSPRGKLFTSETLSIARSTVCSCICAPLQWLCCKCAVMPSSPCPPTEPLKQKSTQMGPPLDKTEPRSIKNIYKNTEQ